MEALGRSGVVVELWRFEQPRVRFVLRGYRRRRLTMLSSHGLRLCRSTWWLKWQMPWSELAIRLTMAESTYSRIRPVLIRSYRCLRGPSRVGLLWVGWRGTFRTESRPVLTCRWDGEGCGWFCRSHSARSVRGCTWDLLSLLRNYYGVEWPFSHDRLLPKPIVF